MIKYKLTILTFLFPILLSPQTGIPEPAPDNEVVYDDGKLVTKPMMRFRHFDQLRGFPSKDYSAEKRIKASYYMENMLSVANKKSLLQAQQPEWRAIGPFNVGGRVKSVAIHPETTAVVYIGAAAGGIWKTIDGGNSWKPIFDNEIGIGFGSICIDPNNPNIIYAATGEAVVNSASPLYLSAGVFKSTDEGETWHNIGLTNAGAFSKFYVHPLNSNKLVGGVIGANSGFYYSSDAGASWNKTDNFDKNVTDVTINPNDENEYFIGVGAEGVYHTTNSGLSWDLTSSGLPVTLGRISVQAAASDPNILYALLEDGGQGGIANIYKSTNRGMSWLRSLRGETDFFRGQGWYDNYIMVHPENPDIVFTGGIHLWRTTNGGQSSSSWNNVSSGKTHVDHHCGAFNPSNLNEIYIGNDGGVYKSSNHGTQFTNVNNGLEITQFYSLDIDQNAVNRSFGGTQDNGTLSNHQNPLSWNGIFGGDGFQLVVDHLNPDIIYGEVNTSGSVYPYVRDLSSNFSKILMNGIDATDNVGIWDAPLEIHPIHNFALYHGRRGLYYSFSSGDYWEKGIGQQAGIFTSIAISPINETLVYAGNISGDLFVTKDHFITTKLSTKGLAARPIKGIECSYINEETAFAVLSGFGTDHVFKTTNAGENWFSISNKFPDIPCLVIKMHPENEDWLFVGTDIGVFATFNGGQTWLPFGRGLPRTIVTDMRILNKNLTGNYILRVATHGRSMWEIDLPTEFITDYEITSPAGGEVITAASLYTYSWYGFDKPVKAEVSWDDGVTWFTMVDNWDSDMLTIKIPNKDTHLNRIRVSSLTNPSQTKISNSFSIEPVRRGSILQTSSFNFVPYGIAWDGKDHIYSTSFYTNKLYKIDKNTLLVVDEFIAPDDSLFTDLTIDRVNNKIFIHRMYSSGETGTGGVVITTDMEGNEIKRFNSPAKNYPIGLEIVDNELLICDRDGKPQFMYFTDTETGAVKRQFSNPYNKSLGPRGICYDGERYLYQASSDFTGNSFNGGYIVKIDKNNIEAEVDRIPLVGRNGNINCRGIEYIPDEKNFWITDFSGNIYKIAGFETIMDKKEEDLVSGNQIFEIEIFPNPVTDFTNIFIESKTPMADIKVVIIDGLGRAVKTLHKQATGVSNSSHFQLDAKGISAGHYNIVFYMNGNLITNKRMLVIK